MTHELTKQTNNGLVVSEQLKGAFWTSLDIVDNIENKKLVYNTLQSQDVRMDEVIDRELPVVNIITERFTHDNDETGEVTDGVLTILLLQSGETVATTSATVFREIGTIMNVFGVPSEDNVLVLKPIKKQGSGKHKYTSLTVI